MSAKTVIAFVLVAFGIVVLAYSGITFKTPGQPVDILGMHFATTVTHFVPPALGAISLALGILLFVVKSGKV